MNQQNEVFAIAADLVNYTDKHVFLTGKAGTGKTTFLKYIRENTHKNTAVVAPTGVAAINAGGTTLHSLLQLPFGIFVPEGSRPFLKESREEIHDRNSLLGRMRITGTKRKVIEALELLIIDEVSMVRADLLDMVDTILRVVRKRNHLPFGGVQVLYIGDMFQLPPVIKDEDWEVLKAYYKSAFFFDAKVIRQMPPVYVELTHVYRQSEEHFVNVLNQVRNNQLDDAALALLRQRFLPDFTPVKDENYITLTTHNYKADQINTEALNAIQKPIFEFEADINDDFPEHALPAEKLLRLKLGAQVMFLKNDLETPRRFFNGKIGIITSIAKDEIKVTCPGDRFPITVTKETWRNIRYTYEANTKSVKEEELGTFVQYPIRLAWAITIHKSQGLTFERAIIDAGQAFAPGQVYVALSRCTSLDGMVLLSPIHRGLVFADERIAMFGRKERPLEQLKTTTAEAKHLYVVNRITETFDADGLLGMLIQLKQLLTQFKDIFNAGLEGWLQHVEEGVLSFQLLVQPHKARLQKLLGQQTDLETNKALQDFFAEIGNPGYKILQENVWVQWRKMPSLQTGNTRKSAEGFLTVVESMNELLRLQILRLDMLKDGFTLDKFFGKRTPIVPVKAVEQPSFEPVPKDRSAAVQSLGQQPSEAEIPHIELYRKLRQLTNAIVNREQIPSYMVANSATLKEMCEWLPLNLHQLKAIKGFGPKKVEWLGDEFLDVIMTYCEEHGIEGKMDDMELMLAKTAKPPKNRNQPITAGNTVHTTLEMWREGKTIDAIAEERNLAKGTIEGHLAQAVEMGEIEVTELIDLQKIKWIEGHLPEEIMGVQLTPIKEKLGDAVTYNELRYVVSAKRRLVHASAED